MKSTIEHLQKRIDGLEQHNRIFESIVAQSPAAIMVTDNQGKIIYVNEAFRNILGYVPEELSYEFTPTIFLNNDPPNSYNELIKTLESGSVWRGEHQIRCKSGKIIWARLILFPLFHQNEITNYVGIINDITNQKISEIKRQEEENLHRLLVESIPNPIAIYDRTGTYLYANDQADKAFKQDKGGVIGKKFGQLVPEKTAIEQYQTLEHVFSTGKPVIVERTLVLDGLTSHFVIIHHPIFDENNEVKTVFAIAQDDTSQVKRKNLLRIQQQIDALNNSTINLKMSLKKAFEYLFQIDWVDAGGIYLFDEDRQKLRLVYSAGLSKDYIKFVSVFSATDVPAVQVLKGKSRFARTTEFLKPLQDVMIKEKLTLSVSIPLKNKKEVFGSLNLGSRSIETLDDYDKIVIEAIAARIANLISLIRTRELLITSNLKLNNSLRKLREHQQLLIQKSRLESLGELSAGLAHEINQPLSVISLAMENILYKTGQSGVTPEYLTRKFSVINQNIGKIQTLIDHVRLFSRDQGSIMFEKIDINKTILDSLSVIGTQLRHHQIKVRTDLAENLPPALGNPSRLEQVMFNLFSNSRDALDDLNNMIMNEVREKDIWVKTFAEDKSIVIKLKDNGTGISKENLNNIFNPFFTTKPEGKGTGLGLAIVYGIVTEMGGTIKVSSEEKKFTEINIYLPSY